MAQETVLVVDDNRVNRRLTEVLLGKAGYKVLAAADAAEAERSVEQFSPRLILMDVQLGDGDGLELTRRLRENPAAKDALILAFTANSAEGDEQKAKAAGCDGYIQKPIDAGTFADQIRGYLEPDAPPVAVDPAEVPAELRKEFITEGQQQSAAWAAADAATLDLEQVRRAVHHWVGIGGTLGYPEITARARELEAVLESSPGEAQFGEMRDLFAAGLEKGFETAEPGAAAIKAGLFGFEEIEFAGIRAAFECANVAVTDLGMMTEGLSAEFFATQELIVLNACAESGVRAWTGIFGREEFKTPVLLVATIEGIGQLGEFAKGRPADFVFSMEPQEILFRARRILSGRAQVEKARTVVIADDDPMVHAILGPAFEKANIRCRSAKDGREALDAIRNSPPDAAILDIGMPRISGLTVLTELRKSPKTRGVPILMLTARQQRSEVGMALGFGANDYVVKPFQAADVVTRLIKLILRESPEKNG